MQITYQNVGIFIKYIKISVVLFINSSNLQKHHKDAEILQKIF